MKNYEISGIKITVPPIPSFMSREPFCEGGYTAFKMPSMERVRRAFASVGNAMRQSVQQYEDAAKIK